MCRLAVLCSFAPLLFACARGTSPYKGVDASSDARADAVTPHDASVDAVTPHDASVDAVTPHDASVDAIEPNDASHCPMGFGGPACSLLIDPSLSSLVPSAGTLNPAFDGQHTTYTVVVAAGASVSLTPSVAYPAHTSITVGGATVASGAASSAVTFTSGAHPVTVTVTTDGGATRSYVVTVFFGETLMLDTHTYFKGSTAGVSDFFGTAVALSGDGSTLAVGALGEASNATGIDGNQADTSAPRSGAVYVFARSSTGWSQQAYIKASNTGAGDLFGSTVALSADGSKLVVGAPNEDSSATGIDGNQGSDVANLNSGAVYVFVRSSTGWSQQAYVKASNTDPSIPTYPPSTFYSGDRFGGAVALSSDGSTLVVGAQGEASNAAGIDGDQTDNNALDSGAVYVFSRTGAAWSQRAYIKSSNPDGQVYPTRGDGFGGAIALSSDGSTLAVGAEYESSSATGIDGDQADDTALYAGAVYVFTFMDSGWSEQGYVKASNAESGDLFGSAVALSADGATLAVGAISEDSGAPGINGNQNDNSKPYAGAVYVFRHSGSGWSQQTYIKSPDPDGYDFGGGIANGDEFGGALSLSSDGSVLIVGAPREDSSATGVGGDPADNGAIDSGAVFVFEYSISTTSWMQNAYVKATNTQADPLVGGIFVYGDNFGSAVSLSPNGSTLAVGALYEDSNATGINGDQSNSSTQDSGAVYLYN